MKRIRYTLPCQQFTTARSIKGLLFAAIAAMALLLPIGHLQAQAFTGSFNLSGGGNDVTSFDFNGTPIADLTVSALTKVGITSSSSTGNFRGSNWPLGATNGSDVFTGSVDTSKYIQFTITAAAGKVINLPSINFGIGRSGTGPRQWQWRSSVDNFAAPIPITTVNAGATEAGGVITVPDANSNWTGNAIQTAGSAYENLSSITFRLYAYNAEATAGTGGLAGNLTFGGSLGDASATAPTISDFTPSSGEVGDSVTINGTNFGVAPTARFNGIMASSSVNGAGTIITATVPPGATTGKITVEVTGEPTATSAADFTVIDPLAPTLSTSGTLTPFSTVLGTASAAQTFTVAGSNLTTDVTVTAPSSFEVASDALTFGPTATLLQTGGTASGTISARLAASAPAGSPSGNITVASTGATTVNVAASGTVTAPTLSLALSPTTVAENAGAGASTGTITASIAPASDLTVTLTSGSPANATVPASVVIASNTTVQTFPIDAVPNPLVFTNVPVLITASAAGYTNGTATLTVSNTDTPPATVIPLTSTNPNSYTQDFDSLGTATISGVFSASNGVQTSLGLVVSTNVNGWYGAKVGGSGTNAFALTANDGSANSGTIYNYGATAAANRSLGALASGSFWGSFGALLRNDTTNTLTAVSVSMTAKFWRSSTVTNNVLTFGYGVVDGAIATTTNFLTATNATALTELNVVGPAPVASNGALDGNNPANQVQFSNVAIPVTLAPGETMFIRWQDANEGGNDAGLAIDDLAFTAFSGLAAPSFDVPAGTYLTSQNVKVSNYAAYGPGIEVRYTLNGSTPDGSSLLYDDVAGIAVTAGNGPVVLKAIAIETPGTETSPVVTATYDMPKDVANLTALRASATGSTIYRVTGEATFTAGTTFRNTKFFQDSAAGIQIDDPSAIITTVYAAGDNVQNFLGRLSVFNGQLQMTPIQDFGAPVSTGNTVTPLARTLATLSNADQAMLVTITNVTFQDAGQNFGTGRSNTPIQDPSVPGFDGVCRNIFGESNITGALIPSGPNTLTGVVQSALYNTVNTLTVGPRNLSDIVFTGTPALSIETNKTALVAGQTGEAAEAIVQITRTGSTDSPLSVNLTQSVAGTFAADVDGSFSYVPFPTSFVIPAGASSYLIYVVALPNAASFDATLTASASGFESADQVFSIQGSGGGSGFTTWLNGAPTNAANVGKYAIGGASSPTATNGIASQTTVTSTNLSITAIVRTNDPNLTVFGEGLTNLTVAPWFTNGVTMTIPGDQSGVPAGTERQIFSVPRTNNSQFLRLDAILQP